MTSVEFAAWRRLMGWSITRCAVELGASRMSIAAWESVDVPARIPLYIALACAHLSKGGKPLGGRVGYMPPKKTRGRPRGSAALQKGIP